MLAGSAGAAGNPARRRRPVVEPAGRPPGPPMQLERCQPTAITSAIPSPTRRLSPDRMAARAGHARACRSRLPGELPPKIRLGKPYVSSGRRGLGRDVRISPLRKVWPEWSLGASTTLEWRIAMIRGVADGGPCRAGSSTTATAVPEQVKYYGGRTGTRRPPYRNESSARAGATPNQIKPCGDGAPRRPCPQRRSARKRRRHARAR